MKVGCQDKKEQKDRQGYLYVFVISYFLKWVWQNAKVIGIMDLKKITLPSSVLYFHSNYKIQKSMSEWNEDNDGMKTKMLVLK